MAAGAVERNPESPGAEGAMHDALIAGSVDDDGEGHAASAIGEVVLCAAQVTRSFFARRGDELDRASWSFTVVAELVCESEHDGETATIVRDSRTVESRAVLSYREVGVAWEDRVEMRANRHWRQ